MIKSSKQKYSQHDLRRLMQERKNKATQGADRKKTKIESPLAKYPFLIKLITTASSLPLRSSLTPFHTYNDLGQLTCVLCQSVVRSEEVWKIHLNAKQHKENVQAAKELKERQATAVKRAAPKAEEVVPEKRPKGILKNATTRIIPPTEPTTIPEATPMEVAEAEPTAEEGKTLPEGFFDDPKKDAVARNLEYKDPVQEEWDRFQKEIREAATVSNEIIAEDQEESTAERQIVEIDEQIRNWSRVLTMEKRKEERMRRLQERAKNRAGEEQKTKKQDEESEDEQEEEESGEGVEEDGNVDEFGSWRAKGWNKSK